MPQVRIASTGGAITAQIVDGNQGVLIATATSANEARAALGILKRPWERRPSVVVAQASESVAIGLLETIERLSPEHVVVAGAPGDSATWAAIERYCREHAIEISYLDTVATLDLPHLTVSIVPSSPEVTSSPGPAYVTISRGDMSIAIALTGLPEGGRFHVGVASRSGPTTADLVVRSAAEAGGSSGNALIVERGRRVVLLVEERRIRVRGGSIVVAGTN